MLPVARKFISEELVKYLRKNLPFGDFLPEQENVLNNPAYSTTLRAGLQIFDWYFMSASFFLLLL